jgi:hypothetical protein
MSDTQSDAFRTYKSLLLRWSGAHWKGAAIALVSILLAAVLQISLLSGWHFARSNDAIPLAPASPSVSAVPAGSSAGGASGASFAYDFVGIPSVAATRTINVPTNSVLGVELNLDRVPQNVLLSLGWIGIRDRQKPTNLAVRLPASESPVRIYVPLRGHPQWRDSATQLAVALAAAPGSPTITVRDVAFVSATPSNALLHAWKSWTSSQTFVKSSAVGERVLPLVALLVIAAVIAFAIIAPLSRNNAVAKRDTLLGASIVLAVAALISLSAGIDLFKSAAAIETTAGWWLVAISTVVLIVANAERNEPQTRLPSTLEWVALGLSIAAAALLGLSLAWFPAVVAVTIAVSRFPAVHARFYAAVYALPVIAVAAIAQAIAANVLTVPGVALVDPTASVMNSMFSIGGFAALPVIIALLYALWPSAEAPRRSSTVALLFWLTMIGFVAVFAVKSAVAATLVMSPLASIALWLAVAAMTIGWLSPRFKQAVATTSTQAVVERTEHDLSDAARQLFDAASDSVDAAFANNRSGTALAPLARMKELAPTSTRTRAAEIRYALQSGRPREAHDAYLSLRSKPVEQLDSAIIATLADYADATADFSATLEYVPHLTASEQNARRIARAQLLTAEHANSGIDLAVATLEQCPEPNNLAHEIVELHLLRDDWKAAQTALSKSAITPQSVSGAVYVARLGWRATGGQQSYVDQLQKLATWHNTLGTAQIGVGEVLQQQGNLAGARARFVVARNTDATLWAIERRVLDIDRATVRNESASEAADAMVPAANSAAMPVVAGAQ